MAQPSKTVLRAKRRASRERTRRRLHQKKTAIKNKRPIPNSQLPKVDPSTVHLIDGSSKERRYLQFWHVFVGVEKAGRVWLSIPSAKTGASKAFITVEISERWRGRGVGALAFRLACEHSDFNVIMAEARKNNFASHRALQKAGFERISDTANGAAQFEWRRKPIQRDVASLVYCESLASRPFPDHESEAREEGVLVRLHASHGCRQDPKVASVAKKSLGILPTDLSSFNRITFSKGRTWGFSMVHSWALVTASWHAWKTGMVPDTCIHVDDHTDLGPCFGSVSNEGVIEVNGLPFKIDSPANVREHLFRGSFNKGSFLIPWAAQTKQRTLHHLCWSGDPESHHTTAVSERGQVALASQEDKSASGNFHYQKVKDLSTSSFEDNLWLDIDLDAFCNRYDGDSDRYRRRGTAKELSLAMDRLEQTISALNEREIIERIHLVTVATSPGFCPSEYWAPLLEKISIGLKAPPAAFSPNG